MLKEIWRVFLWSGLALGLFDGQALGQEVGESQREFGFAQDMHLPA